MPREQKILYHIVDPVASEIAGQLVTPKMRKDGMLLTKREAEFFLASGTLSPTRVEESEELQRMQAGFKRVKRQGSGTAVEAAALAEEQAADQRAGEESIVLARAVDPTPRVGATDQRPPRSGSTKRV